MKSAWISVTAAIFVGLGGTAVTAFASDTVVASLVDIPVEKVAHASAPLDATVTAIDASVSTGASGKVDRLAPATDSVSGSPDTSEDKLAFLYERTVFEQSRAIDRLIVIPVPQWRPDDSGSAEANARAVPRPQRVQSRPAIRAARVASPVVNEVRSRAVLRRDGPIFIGVYR